MSDIRSTEEIQLDHAAGHSTERDSDGEGFAIADGGRGGHDGGLSCSLSEVRWRVRFDSEFCGKRLRKGIELVGVATSDEDATIRKQIRSGMIHSRDGGCGHGLKPSPSSESWIVHNWTQDCVGCKSPSLGSVFSAIDDEYLSGGKKNHVPHVASRRHILHHPCWVRRQG